MCPKYYWRRAFMRENSLEICRPSAIKNPMLGLLSLLFAASFCRVFTDQYHNGFGIECGQGHEHCLSSRCILIGSAKVCTRCRPGYVPIDGVCRPYSKGASSVCIPERPLSPTSPSRCIDCGLGKSMFLFYGGCYTLDRSSIGGYICSHASGGMCTECNVGAQGSYVFTNPDVSAAERCILCSDTTGFSGYRGVSECHSCAQPVGSGVATALCTKCRSPEQGGDLGPIDHQCQAKGPHDCRAGVCLSCYKTHLLHQSGCYSRHSTTGTAVCAAANQYVLDNVTICGECADASYAPVNGACTRVHGGTADAEPHDCTQGRDKGLCTDCAGSAESFLFYGGCYGKGSGTGAKLCSAVASGVCTEWKRQFDFIFSKDGKSGGYLCGDAENGGISGCATC
ncbi:High cysteine membrane protein Group 4, partial [Giardia lamblia P15]